MYSVFCILYKGSKLFVLYCISGSSQRTSIFKLYFFHIVVLLAKWVVKCGINQDQYWRINIGAIELATSWELLCLLIVSGKFLYRNNLIYRNFLINYCFTIKREFVICSMHDRCVSLFIENNCAACGRAVVGKI